MLPHFTRPRHSRALCRACYLNTLYGYFWADDARWHADMPHRCKHCWHVGIAHLLLPHIIFINSATPCMCNKLRAAYAAWRLSLLPRNALFSTHDWCFRKHPSMCRKYAKSDCEISFHHSPLLRHSVPSAFNECRVLSHVVKHLFWDLYSMRFLQKFQVFGTRLALTRFIPET